MLRVPAYRIFVSSTSRDFQDVRQAAWDAVMSTGNIPIGMEYWPADSRPSLEVIQENLRHCDIYLGILGPRYGSTLSHPESDQMMSYTEYEYRYAEKLGKSVLMLMMTPDDASNYRGGMEHDDPDRKNDDRYLQFREHAERNQVSYFPGGDGAARVVEALVRDAIHNLIRRRAVKSPGLIPADQVLPIHLARFLEPALSSIAHDDLLSSRCDTQVEVKEELSRFFWHYCFTWIIESPFRRIFFESGSTTAFLAEALLNAFEKNRGMAAVHVSVDYPLLSAAHRPA